MLEFIAPLPAQPRILTSLDHPCGLSPRAIWGLSQVFKNDLVFEGCKGCLEECPEWPSNTERPGRRMVRSSFFPDFLMSTWLGLFHWDPRVRTKQGWEAAGWKVVKKNTSTDLDVLIWNINGHRLKSHQLVAGVHNKSLRWWCSMAPHSPVNISSLLEKPRPVVMA